MIFYTRTTFWGLNTSAGTYTIAQDGYYYYNKYVWNVLYSQQDEHSFLFFIPFLYYKSCVQQPLRTQMLVLVEKVLKENLANPDSVFLDLIMTKILRLLLYAIHSHLYQLILLPPMIPPLWFQKSIQSNQSMKTTQVCLWIAFCRKTKTKLDSSSLRNLKIIPRNLYEILLLWIPSQYCISSSDLVS